MTIHTIMLIIHQVNGDKYHKLVPTGETYFYGVNISSSNDPFIQAGFIITLDIKSD